MEEGAATAARMVGLDLVVYERKLRNARGVSHRDLLSCFQNPDQLGRPAALNTDARLGPSAMSYRAREIGYGFAGRRRFTLFAFRALWRRAARPRKHVPTQRRKVGLC